jgi:hypothetical protein
VSHALMRDRLIALAGSTSQDPGGFLQGLSDIHFDWHNESPTTYGFLLFHNRVVNYFKAIVLPAVEPTIEPFTEREFRDMGVQLLQDDPASADTLGGLATFSSSIRSWHNTAHDNIGQATGTPMLDPRQNIFFRPFWQLHLFIDDLFQVALQQYGDQAHTGQFVMPSAVAGHIEARHHGWVPAI